MNLSEIDSKNTYRIAINKSNKDPDGNEFEIALFKAMYIYPPPEKDEARKSTLAHAKQIYDAECVERSICDTWPEFFKPLTYVNVMNHFEGDLKKHLLKGKIRTVTKNRLTQGSWQPYYEHKTIQEYEYMFNDIFHIDSSLILECKVYTDDNKRRGHINAIRNKIGRYRSADYFILAYDSGHNFEITDCMSMTRQGYARFHDFREFVV